MPEPFAPGRVPYPFRSYLHETPDGQDCLRKSFHCAKLGVIVGGYMASYDILGISHPRGFMNTVGRAASFVGPVAGAAGLFAASSCLLGEIRGEDGPLNHVIGGVLAGGALGPRFAAPGPAVAIALVLGGTAGLIKHLKSAGVNLFAYEVGPKEVTMKGKIFAAKNHYPEPKSY